MHIRKLLKTDYEQWLTLWQGYQQFYQVSLCLDLSQLTFDRLTHPDEQMGCFVIEIDQQLVGLVHYVFHRSTWTKGNYCYLQDLFVTTAKRGQGYGKTLIEAVYAEAHEQQCSRVYWLTQENNHQARSLYDQVAINTGFIQYRKSLV